MLNNFFSLSSWPWSRNGEERRLGFSGLVPLDFEAVAGDADVLACRLRF